ncbi:MAG: phospholipid carrier-dependent glycosyltransferase [Caldilineales bacterium]|nr:phospholipid carrier-dependent glycosyltransferase [Caldilineales bacterium]
MPNHLQRKINWGIALILAAFAILALAYSVAFPIYEAPDEDSHYRYVRHLADGKGFPIMDAANPGLLAQEAGQPPLYYILAAALTGWVQDGGGERILAENPHSTIGRPLLPGNKNRFIHAADETWPWRGLAAGVHAARLFSILLGLGTVFLTFLLAQTLFSSQPALALASAALVAFTPQFIFLSAAVSNDNLIILLSTLSLYLLVRVAGDGFRRSWLAAILIGIVLGLAALTKLGGLTLLALAGFAYLMQAWRTRRWRRNLLQLGLAFLVALLVAGWWYARNWLVYGDPTGLATFLAIVGPRAQALTLASLPSELQGLRISLLALFGWFNIIWPGWVYRLFDAFLLAASVGLLLRLGRLMRRGISARTLLHRHRAFLLLPAWILLSLLALLRWVTLTPAAQGRLLFPAIAAIATMLMTGWAGLWPRQRVWLAFPPAAFLALALLSLPIVILPGFHKPDLIPVSNAPITSSDDAILFDDRLLLLGVEGSPEPVRAGDNVDITLYWQALQPVPYNATQFIKALDRNGEAISQINSYNGWGTFPTSLWPSDTVIVDKYRLPIPEDVDAPTLLSIDVGLYDYDTDDGYSSRRLDGRAAPDSVMSLRVLPRQGQTKAPDHPLAFDFAGQIRLLGYDIDRQEVNPGKDINLKLYWQGDELIAEDYQVFVHLLDQEGQRVIGFDGAPRGGRWPTNAWEPGQVVEDVRPLPIPADLSPGLYTLAVGLYRLDTFERLSATGATEQIADRAVWLTQVEVRP